MVSDNAYTHVEIVTNDPEAATTFYEKAFGWKITRFGAEMNNYIMYETPDGIGGGIRKPEQGETPGILTYVQVANLKKSSEGLVSAGAKQLGPQQDVPGMGSMAVFMVPGGTLQALWEPAKQ